MKLNGLKSVILVSSLMALFGCSHNDVASSSSLDDKQREVSFTFKGFETKNKKPYAYLEEGMKYVPVTISFEKGREKGNLMMKDFSLSSTKPVSIFKDLNNNKILDEDEMDSLVDIDEGSALIEWIEDGTPNKDSSILSANYMLYKEDGISDNTVVSFAYRANATALEKYCEGDNVFISIRYNEETLAPSSVTLLYDKPEEHITVVGTPDQTALYKTNVAIKDDGVLRVTGVENAEYYIKKDQTYTHYKYHGLDGEVIIKYEINIKDKYYKDKNVSFGEGEYKYNVEVNGHDHTLSSPRRENGMNVYSCSCEVFEAYELDTANAISPIDPDLNNPAEMMGNDMFKVEWDVRGIKKGRYKVYVHASTSDNQNDLKWFTVEDGGSTTCPSYIRIGEKETTPCTEKTFGETFESGTGWRWTNDYIFDINIPEGLERLSILSGNNNGHLNDYNMFFRGLRLVPFSEEIAISSL